MKKQTFILLTAVFVLIISFCITGTVKGQNNRRLSLNNQYEKEMEEEYIQSIKDELSDMGYSYAGVTLTKVVNEDKEKIYTLSIHHRRIDKMSKQERQALIDKLSEVKLLGDEYLVETKILEYNC